MKGADPATEDAARRFAAEHGPRLLALALRLCDSREDAEDLAARALERAWAARDDYRPVAPFDAWLRTILLNLWRNDCRARARRPAPSAATPLPPDALPDPAPAPDEQAAARGDAEAARRAVAALPPRLRAPVVLHYFEGLGVGDVARELNLPAGTVKFRLFEARLRLKGLLKAVFVLVALLALGAGAAAVLYHPDPLLRNIPSIAVRDATFPELLDAVRDELARLDPDPEAAVSFRIELPEDRRVEDLPHVTIAAHNVTALAFLDTAAGLVGLESRREGSAVAFVPKPDVPPAPPEGTVVHYGNEWDRDPATRPAVLETREWAFPDGTASPPRPCTSLEWKTYLAARGVDWPYGSSLAWSEDLGILRIENAPEQLERAEEIIASFLRAEDEGGVPVE